MKTLKSWTVDKQSANHLELVVDTQHRLCLYVLEENLFRVLIKRKGELALDRTWSIAPEQDVPWEGRRRDDLSGFTCPAWTLTQQDDTVTVGIEQVGAGGTVVNQRLPLARFIAVVPLQPQGLVDGDAQLFGRYG